MNISASTIYFWQLADELKDTCNLIGALLAVCVAVAAFICLFVYVEDINTGKAPAKRALFLSSSLALVNLLLSTFLPSSSTVAMMVVVPEIAHSKVIQQDLPDIYNAAIESLKTAIKPITAP